MIKKSLIIFILIIFVFNVSSIRVVADSSQDIILKNKTNFQQMSENIIGTNKQITALNIQTEKLNIQTEKLNIAIQNGNLDITKCEKKIIVSKIQMQMITKQVDSSQKLANIRIRELYMNGCSGDSYFIALLTSKNISDFFIKQEAVKSLMTFDKKLMSDLETKKKVQNQSMDNLSTENQQLQQLKYSNVRSLQQLSDKKKNLQDLIKKYNQEKNSAALIIKENEEDLVARAILVINSQYSSSNDIKIAVDTLKSLVLQLNTVSVKQEAKDCIYLGNKKLSRMISTSAKSAASEQSYSRSSDATYKASYTMNATAYTGGTLTAMGLKPIRNLSGISTIAVDPNVIPLGSKVYIPGYGNAICSDTGGLIKGNIIDLYMNSVAESLNWGRRKVTLYVIAYPGQW